MRRLFEVNSEPHTGARPSVRLCVGLNNAPDLIRARVCDRCVRDLLFIRVVRVLENQYFLYRLSQAGNKIIATNCMPEVVSDSPYDIMKMLGSRPQVAS